MADNLKKYHLKRNFKKTREPKGKVDKSTKRLKFVVQHHLARRDHYDLRLEWNGVLKSFAVPMGPSYQMGVKRLAIAVEDHPISYRNFEGVIPKGEYGGGVVMLWDYGYWQFLEPFSAFKNTFKFELRGQRLHGIWTLILLHDNQWLLLKEKDYYANYIDISVYDRSVKSGRTMKEIEMNLSVSFDDVMETIPITSGDKMIFKKHNITKYDILQYYQKVAYRMLPLIRNRIISTVRCPDGDLSHKFYKKHFEINYMPGIKCISRQKKDYYYIEDVRGIISEVQMNGFEFHMWGSKAQEYNYPDLMVFDLDPDENVSLKQLRQGVRDLKSILDELNLMSFLKTSGGKGYHIVVVMNEKVTWRQFENIARDIAKLMVVKWPDRYVVEMSKKKRKNKIFIDWFRNKKGSTSVAPYSLRLKSSAAVSMPISWSELDKVKPDAITIQEALKRLKRKDPWEELYHLLKIF